MNKFGIFAVSLVVLLSVLLGSEGVDVRGGLKARLSVRKIGEEFKTGADIFLESQAQGQAQANNKVDNNKIESDKRPTAPAPVYIAEKVEVTVEKDKK